MRGTLTDDEQARWQQIKADFLRNKAMGADDADVGGRVVAQLADIAVGLQRLGEPAPVPAPQPAPWEALLSALHSLRAPERVAAATPTPAVDTAPVLQALQHTMARQDQLNGALVALAQALRNGASPAAAAGTRKPKPRSPREAEFDQVIASLEFREERPTPTLDVSPARVRDEGDDPQ